jgi:hypothetical protein
MHTRQAITKAARFSMFFILMKTFDKKSGSPTSNNEPSGPTRFSKRTQTSSFHGTTLPNAERFAAL